ncbi:MAG: GNAT family N-acetyltransferase [Candidatus Zixiibacteriota bacterium]
MTYEIRTVTDSEKDWVLEVVRGWGANFVVTRGRKVFPAEIEGFYAIDVTGKKVGLVTFEIIGDQCEVVTLDAFEKFRGIGTALMERVRQVAAERGCRRLWLITTNDNLDAIRFYQRKGFTIAAVHVNALAESRKIKPSIPDIGWHGIPLRDEIEFEMFLYSKPR